MGKTNWVCGDCGERCRGDVTILDHGRCYDCHHEVLAGERCSLCGEYGHDLALCADLEPSDDDLTEIMNRLLDDVLDSVGGLDDSGILQVARLALTPDHPVLQAAERALSLIE